MQNVFCSDDELSVRMVCMIATPDSWIRIPFTEGFEVPYRDTFSRAELARISEGLIPLEMEDKWFIYFLEPDLFLHRSWSGQPVYKVTLARQGEHAIVIRALISMGLKSDDKSYEARLLDFLISNLLLGRGKPFPLPDEAAGASPGAYQHMVAGTGYLEVKHSSPTRRRPWWKFWR